MKYLLMGAAAITLLTGCHSDSNYRGRPAQDSYIEGSNDRAIQNRTTDNMRDVGRQSSPTAPFSSPNGSQNF